MHNIFKQLLRDENGFIISAELILIGTIAVLSMVVGLSAVSSSVNHELNDVAQAFGSMNQSYRYDGMKKHGDRKEGGKYRDRTDFCDMYDITTNAPKPEKGHGYR